MNCRLVMAKAGACHASIFFAVVMLAGAVVNGAPAPLSTTIPVGDGPVALAIGQRARIVFVVNVRADSVSLIDARARQLMRTIHVGQLPHDVGVNARRGVADVADANDGTVSLIDTFPMTVLATLPVGQFPDATAVESRSGCVCVANRLSTDVSIVACDGALSRAMLGPPIGGDAELNDSGRRNGLA